jgi:hypothetical protein
MVSFFGIVTELAFCIEAAIERVAFFASPFGMRKIVSVGLFKR